MPRDPRPSARPRRRRLCAVLLALCVPLSGAAAPAPSTVERIQARGVVRCGSVERPGLAHAGADGRWSGLLVDICGAIATALLGSPDRIAYAGYASEADFDRIRADRDDVAFLTGAEINAHGLAGVLLPGPNVYIARNAVMVPGAAREQHVAELAGGGICFLSGESAERSLEAWFDERRLAWLRHAYSEDGEMVDAYAAQRCHAIAGEATRLAAQAHYRGAEHLASRILPEALNRFPVVAATSTRDGRWAAIVAWTVNTLVNGARPDGKWYAGGAGAMPLAAPELGLAGGWQARVLAASGSYCAIRARHLGAGGPCPQGGGAAGKAPDEELLLPYVE